ncbi:MAG: hypothetical protein DME16_00330 [Candidatus Rokuibacteriota bacterium]|nr:MAG: hypothetical protein DME16_00330 [Candidatus Rokubacteria bacterium]
MTAMGKIAVVAVFSVVSLVLSLLLSGRMLVRLPADYFTSRLRPPPTSLWAKVGWNLLGGALVIVGIALSIPGVPGQGVLTILAGLILMDFPGKRRLLLAALRRGPVRAVVDRLRARRGRPPLEIPPDP